MKNTKKPTKRKSCTCSFFFIMITLSKSFSDTSMNRLDDATGDSTTSVARSKAFLVTSAPEVILARVDDHSATEHLGRDNEQTRTFRAPSSQLLQSLTEFALSCWRVSSLSRMRTSVGWADEKVAMLPKSPTWRSREVGSPWSFCTEWSIVRVHRAWQQHTVWSGPKTDLRLSTSSKLRPWGFLQSPRCPWAHSITSLHALQHWCSRPWSRTFLRFRPAFLPEFWRKILVLDYDHVPDALTSNGLKCPPASRHWSVVLPTMCTWNPWSPSSRPLICPEMSTPAPGELSLRNRVPVTSDMPGTSSTLAKMGFFDDE